jgi:hypothetical protein
VQAGRPRQPELACKPGSPCARSIATPPPHGQPRAILRGLLIVLLITCSGCTSFREYVRNRFKVGPNYQKPAAPVAEHWIDANDVRVRSKTDDISHWWTVFRDPVLDRLIADAYRQNLRSGFWQYLPASPATDGRSHPNRSRCQNR